MSSEQRYDGSYEQFIQDELPKLDGFDLPDLDHLNYLDYLNDLNDLFGDPTITSDTADSFYNLLENGQANAQQGGQPLDDLDTTEKVQQFNMTWDGTGYFDPNAFATVQPSAPCAFAPLHPAATSQTVGQSFFDVGRLPSLEDESYIFDNTAGYCHLS